MKKYLAMLLCVAMILSLVACGGGEVSSVPAASEPVASAPEAAPQPETEEVSAEEEASLVEVVEEVPPYEPTEEEKAADIAWETRQLEIMDWLTDDVDWITGEKHDAIRFICAQ